MSLAKSKKMVKKPLVGGFFTNPFEKYANVKMASSSPIFGVKNSLAHPINTTQAMFFPPSFYIFPHPQPPNIKGCRPTWTFGTSFMGILLGGSSQAP